MVPELNGSPKLFTKVSSNILASLGIHGITKYINAATRINDMAMEMTIPHFVGWYFLK